MTDEPHSIPGIPVPSRVDDELEDIRQADTLDELIESGELDEPESYGFEDRTEMIEYMLGEGRYADQNGLDYEGHDGGRANQKQILEWYKCPSCMDEIDDMLDEGVDRSDIHKDPTYEITVTKKTDDMPHNDKDSKHEVTRYVVYCQEHGTGDKEEASEFMYFEEREVVDD